MHTPSKGTMFSCRHVLNTCKIAKHTAHTTHTKKNDAQKKDESIKYYEKELKLYVRNTQQTEI